MADHEVVPLKVLVSELSGDIAEAKSPDYLDPEALGIPILAAATMARAPLLGTMKKEGSFSDNFNFSMKESVQGV